MGEHRTTQSASMSQFPQTNKKLYTCFLLFVTFGLIVGHPYDADVLPEDVFESNVNLQDHPQPAQIPEDSNEALDSKMDAEAFDTDVVDTDAFDTDASDTDASDTDLAQAKSYWGSPSPPPPPACASGPCTPEQKQFAQIPAKVAASHGLSAAQKQFHKHQQIKNLYKGFWHNIYYKAYNNPYDAEKHLGYYYLWGTKRGRVGCEVIGFDQPNYQGKIVWVSASNGTPKQGHKQGICGTPIGPASADAHYSPAWSGYEGKINHVAGCYHGHCKFSTKKEGETSDYYWQYKEGHTGRAYCRASNNCNNCNAVVGRNIKSIMVAPECEKALVWDNDSMGSKDNMWIYPPGVKKLPWDLQDDIMQIDVYSKVSCGLKMHNNGEYWKLYNNEMSQKAMKATATLKEMAKKQAEKYFKQYGHNWRVAEAKAKAQERDTKENHKKTDAAFFREMDKKIYEREEAAREKQQKYDWIIGNYTQKKLMYMGLRAKRIKKAAIKKKKEEASAAKAKEEEAEVKKRAKEREVAQKNSPAEKARQKKREKFIMDQYCELTFVC